MKNLKINLKKLKALFIAGSLTLAMGGCGYESQQSSETATSSDSRPVESASEEILTETTEIVETKDLYSPIAELETNVVDFAEDYLPYGFGETEINDANKKSISEMYTNAYIMLNTKELGRSLAVLDQELEIIPSEAAKDFMEFARLTAHYSQIQTPDTMLDFSSLVANEEDAKFLNNLSEEIAYMNVATTDKERQERINNIIEIKKNLIEYYETEAYEYSTLYVALNMIIEADATAKAYSSEIISSDEDKNQIYNTVLKYNCGEEEVDTLATTLIAMDDVQAKNSLESKVSVYYKELLEDLLNKVNNMDLGSFESYYAYGEVTSRISSKLVGLYVAPAMTNIELENSIRQHGPANGKNGVGTSTSTTVDPDKVPDNAKEPTKVEKDDTNNGKDIKDVDIDDDTIVNPSEEQDSVDAVTAYSRGKQAGANAGSAAAGAAHDSLGTIPSTISSAPTPSVPSKYSKFASDYIAGYAEGYVTFYNNYVASAKSAQSAPTISYEQVDGPESVTNETIEDIPYVNSDQNNNGTYFVPVDNGSEIIINETIETYTKEVNSDSTEEYYEEVIEEVIEDVTSKEELIQLRNMVLAFNYNTNDEFDYVTVKRV